MDYPAKVLALTALLFGTGSGWLYAGGASEPREIAVSVNGVQIPRSYWEREVRRFEDQLRQQGQAVDAAAREAIAGQALDTLINMELLFQESRRRDIVVSPEQVEQQVAELRQRFADEAAFLDALSRMGFSATELETEMERQLGVQGLIDRDIVPTVVVAPEDLRGYYEANRDVFRSPEQIRARHILLRLSPDADLESEARVRGRLEEIRQRILAGEDFGALARTLSEDSSSADGGDLGFFPEQQVVPAFAAAAFSLSDGELSQPVRTDFGYHLIELTGRKAGGVLAFEEVEPRLRAYLRHERVMSALDELAVELRASAVIEETPGAQAAD